MPRPTTESTWSSERPNSPRISRTALARVHRQLPRSMVGIVVRDPGRRVSRDRSGWRVSAGSGAIVAIALRVTLRGTSSPREHRPALLIHDLDIDAVLGFLDDQIARHLRQVRIGLPGPAGCSRRQRDIAGRACFGSKLRSDVLVVSVAAPSVPLGLLVTRMAGPLTLLSGAVNDLGRSSIRSSWRRDRRTPFPPARRRRHLTCR